jgi:D-alanyl-D-alanine carboxypeptidase
MMNDAARRLGMRESNFVNPHGLPDDRQQTSARDMAILARALLSEFPEQDDLFHIGAIQFGRRIMRNHNGLIGRYPGADGMKTGFICASGFNVVASAVRDGRRLITVVLGSSSANERTMMAAELFDRGFASRPTFASPSLAALPASTLQSPPNMRPVICDRRGPMPGEDDGGATVSAGADSGVPNLFSSNVLAYAGASTSADTLRRTPLGPRGPVQPVQVWVGLNPPSSAELEAQAAAEEAAEKARQSKSKKTARKPASGKGTDAKITLPEAAIQEGKGIGKGKNGRASVTLKPISGADVTKEKSADKPLAAPLKLQPPSAKSKPEQKKPAAKAEATAKPASKAN